MQANSCQPCDAAANGSSGQAAETTEARVTFQPHVDIVHSENEVLITADVPGADAEGIEVRFERGVLELRARIAARPRSGSALLAEYGVGDFQRSFRLPDELDGSKASAEYANGVLRVRVPKAEQARSRRIEVTAGRG